MKTDLVKAVAHPVGEQPEQPVVEEWSAVADTFAGRVQIEWDDRAPVTPLGQLPFFIEYLKQGGLFDGWVADCPLLFRSPNAPRKRDVLGTLLLSILAGHRRYAHVTALRCDPVNPPLLGMRKVVSEDALRRAMEKIDEAAGLKWLQGHLDYCLRPLLDEAWILDVDTTIKPLYGHQEGAVVGYNPRKPGRPAHCYHTYMLSQLRLVLRVDVQPGDQHNAKHAAVGLWSLLAQLGRSRWPQLLRGDAEWGNEGVMARAEQEGLPYLFRLRTTANVKRALERAMVESDWAEAGQGWQGKETSLRLVGWSRRRRVVLLRRRVERPLALVDRRDPAQPLLGFAEVVDDAREVWEYAALVTSVDSEIMTLGQLYRDRADCENTFDELKNHWGWGGFTTHDLKRCRLLASSVALIYNWWSLFVRLADPDHHREVITSRPLLLHAIARKTQHANQTTLTISSTHGEQHKARRAYLRIARFFTRLRQNAEQLDVVQRWYRILSEALRHYLRGRQLIPPARLRAA
jgi:Transposase DDE domain group 1